MTKMREDFEAWAKKTWGNNAYRHTSPTCGEWDAWQAALTAPADDVVRDALEQMLDALEQMLDDMGTDGLCVCQATKDLAIAAMKEKQNG